MIVVESSAVVDALVGHPANPQLLAVLTDRDLHAPSLLDYEVASALRGHAHGGKLSGRRVDEAAQDFTQLRIERFPLAPMMRDVLDLLHHFTVCDAAYVVLARALASPLITADEKLAEARRLGVDVRVFWPSDEQDDPTRSARPLH